MSNWREHAACASPAVDPEWFFTTDDTMKRWALEVCGRCPVKEECLQEGFDTGETYGIRAEVDLAKPSREVRARQKQARVARGSRW